MSKFVIRQDDKGLKIHCGGYVARPGGVVGYDHAYRMDSHTLQVGTKVHARHLSGTPLTKLTCEDGTVLHWYHDGMTPEVAKFFRTQE